MSVLLDDQMNSVINCLTAKSTWDDLILYHEGPSDMKESRVIDIKLCYNTLKFKEGETLTQTFTKYKALMNELVNDVIKLSKLEINTGFINRLPKKWLSFCQSLRNTNHVKDSELASLFAKYNKVKAKLALLSLSASASKAATIKNKGLIVEAYEWDEEEVEQIASQKKRILGVDQLTEDLSCSEQTDLVFVKSLADDTKVSIPSVKIPWLSEAKGFILPNHDTGMILLVESQRNTIDPLVAVTNSSAIDYDSTDESSVCSTPLPPLKKLDGAELVSRPK
ncbi:hypothetical protein Tco_1490158, partial [Tanacetum coccineum]